MGSTDKPRMTGGFLAAAHLVVVIAVASWGVLAFGAVPSWTQVLLGCELAGAIGFRRPVAGAPRRLRPILLATLSLDDPEEAAYYPFRQEALASRLAPGTNVLAVEVHQGDPASSDVRFDLEPTVSVTPPPSQ